ncbi:hypothetical protein BDQ17DRAFT_618356 [Cyathus striatus]|nr:hypothetical protein BDQ17DRAFT_618356 [Cyathus striatus]
MAIVQFVALQVGFIRRHFNMLPFKLFDCTECLVKVSPSHLKLRALIGLFLFSHSAHQLSYLYCVYCWKCGMLLYFEVPLD